MYDIRAYMVGNMISEIVLGFCTDIFFKKNMNVTAAVPIFASCKIRIEVAIIVLGSSTSISIKGLAR